MAEQWWSKYKPTEYSFSEWKAEANRLYKEERLTKDQIQSKIGYPVDDQGNPIKTTNKGSAVKPNFDTRTGNRAGQGKRRGAAAAVQTVGEDVYNKGVVAAPGSGLEEHHKRVVGLYKPFFEGLNPRETKELAQWFVDESAPLGNVKGNLEALTKQQHEAIHSWMKENRMQVSSKKFPSFKNMPLNERLVAALTFLEQIQPAADEELANIKNKASQVDLNQRQQPATPIDAPETGPNALRVARNLAPAALSIPAGLAVSAQSAAAAIKQPTEENIVNAGFDIGNTAADLVGLIPTPMTVAGSEAAQRALMMGQMTYNAQRQMQKQEQEGGKETMAGFDILNELEYIGNQLRNFKMPYRRFGGSYTPMKDR